MRAWAQLFEDMNLIPRMWFGPRGESFDLDDNWTSHWQFVLDHQEMMGVDFGPEAFGNSKLINSAAQTNGWIRISMDTNQRRGGMAIAMSAVNIRNIQKGIRWLHENHYFPDHIEVEINSPTGDTEDFIVLHDYDEIDTFCRYGKIRRAA